MSFYQRSFEVRAPLNEVAAFHDDPASLTAITPPPVRVTLERFDAPVHVGSHIDFVLHVGPIAIRWNAKIEVYDHLKSFRDVQARGPFGAWAHTHTFVQTINGTLVVDRVEYEPPFGWFGKLIDPFIVRPSLMYLFHYRAQQTRRILESVANQSGLSWVSRLFQIRSIRHAYRNIGKRLIG
jgi:ligand-binding SRPBCC domain-containing protein